MRPISLNPVTPRRPDGAAEEARRVTSFDLLGARREIVIVHQGRDYRLRVTRSGKLMLTA
jgi:hemin uptake protein HemP